MKMERFGECGANPVQRERFGEEVVDWTGSKEKKGEKKERHDEKVGQ